MQQLGEKAMTDEKTDSDDPSVLVKRTLPCHSKKLSTLTIAIDNRNMSKKVHVIGSPRKLPKQIPKWASTDTNSSHSSSSSIQT